MSVLLELTIVVTFVLTLLATTLVAVHACNWLSTTRGWNHL